MILNEAAYKTKSNLNNQSTFQIQSSSKAFKILSSNLYKDKISAVIREISTNAVDAQVANKNPNPIKVQLPTYEDSTFIVADEGIGMTEIEIYQLYTTYFGSNKTDSNDYVGALGLGSKSPFAYTDQFTVESSKDGVRNVFSCFLDDRGMPTLSKVASRKTNKTGTTVTVPVNESDIRYFKEKAIKIYTYFEKLPDLNIKEVTDGIIEKQNPDNIILSGKGYKVTKDKNAYYNNSRFEVVMGNIRYPLSVDDSNIGDIPLIQTMKNTSYQVLTLYVELGQVDIAPSREELSYDKSTISNLFIMLNKVSNSIQKEFVKKISKLGTERERILYKAENRGFLRHFKNPALTNEGLQEIANKNAGNAYFSIYVLKEGRKEGERIYRMKKVEWAAITPSQIYKNAFIEMNMKNLNKRGVKNSIIKYVKSADNKSIDKRYVTIISSANLRNTLFFKQGCEIIKESALPEVEKTVGVKKAKLSVDYMFNCKKVNTSDIFNTDKKVYYLISYRGDVESLKEYFHKVPNMKDGETTNFLRDLGFPIIVIKTNTFRLRAKTINSAKNLIELTDRKIKRTIRKQVKEKMAGFEDILLSRHLFSHYKSLESLSGSWFQGGVRISDLERLMVTLTYLDVQQRSEIMKNKTFSKLAELNKYCIRIKTVANSYPDFSEAQLRIVTDIIERELVKDKAKVEILKKEYNYFEALTQELGSNFIVNALLDSLSYREIGKEQALNIYESFLKF